MRGIILVIMLSFSQLQCFAVELSEPTCSKNGTHILYINGMRTDDATAIKTESQISSIISNSDLSKLDKSKKVTSSYVLQTSMFKTVQGKGDIPEFVGNLYDGWEVAGNWIEDKMLLIGHDHGESWEAIARMSFGVAKYSNVYLRGADLALKAFAESTESIFQPELSGVLSNTSDSELDSMVTKAKSHLLLGQKVINVSHSQGNFFANMLYDKLFNKGTNAIVLANLKGYWSNLQLAAPTSGTLAPISTYITGHQDNIIQLAVGSVGANYYYSSNYYDVDSSGHGVLEIYLSNGILGSPSTPIGPFDGSMAEIFYSKLSELASRMAPNCCEKADGSLTNEILVPFQSGFVPQHLKDFPPQNFQIKGGAAVCKDVTVHENVTLDGSVYVSGNTELRNCEMHTPFQSGGSINIVGGSGNGVSISGSFGAPEDKHPLSIVALSGSLRISGSSTEIGGIGQIQNESGSSSIKDSTIKFNDRFNRINLKNSKLIDTEIISDT